MTSPSPTPGLPEWPSHWKAPEEREELLQSWARSLLSGFSGNAWEHACIARAYLRMHIVDEDTKERVKAAAAERFEHALDGVEEGAELKVRIPERYKVQSPPSEKAPTAAGEASSSNLRGAMECGALSAPSASVGPFKECTYKTKDAPSSATQPKEFTEAEKAMNRDYTLGKCP